VLPIDDLIDAHLWMRRRYAEGFAGSRACRLSGSHRNMETPMAIHVRDSTSYSDSLTLFRGNWGSFERLSVTA
jgi:hypothetical protein